MKGKVEACHIMSESTMKGVDPEGGSRKAAKVCGFTSVSLPFITDTHGPDRPRRWCHGHSQDVWTQRALHKAPRTGRYPPRWESSLVGAQLPQVIRQFGNLV